MILRLHHRHFTPLSSSPRLCVNFSDSFSPSFPALPSSVYSSKFRILQPLCLPLLRKLPGCVPTIPILVHPKCRGGESRYSPLYSSPFFSHSCALFCSFLRSRKTQPFSFQSLPHSLRKPPGWGEGRPNANQRYRTNFCPYTLTSLRLCFLVPQETASARQEENRRWTRVVGNAGEAAPALSLSIPSRC